METLVLIWCSLHCTTFVDMEENKEEDTIEETTNKIENLHQEIVRMEKDLKIESDQSKYEI